MKKKIFAILSILLLVIVAFKIGEYSEKRRQMVIEEQIKGSLEIGDEIVKALETYKQKNGIYPVKLEQLCPDYIRSIPLPLYGKKIWHYRTYRDSKEYGLFLEGERATSKDYMHTDSNNAWQECDNSF